MRSAVVASFVLAALLASSTVVAQAPAPPPPSGDAAASLGDELNGIAKSEYLAGRGLFLDGDFRAALVKFQSALDASQDMRLLWNLAACERALRHYAQAVRYLERYKAEGGAKVTDADRRTADERIAGLRPFVAAITVRSNQADASVLLDDVEIGKTPLEKYLVDLGDHRLVVRKTGFQDRAQTLSVTGTADLVLEVDVAAPPHEGRLVVNAGTTDVIAVDGATVGSGTYSTTLPSGTHVLRVTAKGKTPYESRVAVEDGQTRSVDVTLEREPSGLPAWAWIGIGVGAATALGLTGYLVFSKGDATAASPVEGTMPPRVVQLPAFRPHLSR